MILHKVHIRPVLHDWMTVSWSSTSQS